MELGNDATFTVSERHSGDGAAKSFNYILYFIYIINDANSIFITNNIIDTYARYTDQYCLPDDLGYYDNYDNAESACSMSVSCKMFFELSFFKNNGGRAIKYVLCGLSATKHISFGGSVLYVKGN